MNFYKLNTTVSVVELMMQLQQHPELWDQDTMRTSYSESPHHQVSDIILRFDFPPLHREQMLAAWRPSTIKLPAAETLINQLYELVQGEQLGRCLITKLRPGKVIPPHEDGGRTAEYYERFHIPLQTAEGNLFRCGGEVVHMRVGEAWWFQNLNTHDLVNNSDIDRIHLIVDIRTKNFQV